MKKQITILLCSILFTISVSVCGCTSTKKSDSKSESTINTNSKSNIDSSDDFISNSDTDSSDDLNTNSAVDTSASSNDNDAAISKEAPFSPYAVNSLTLEQEAFYHELKDHITAFEPFYYSTEEYDHETLMDIICANDALLIDMPQIKNYYWLDYEFDNDAEIIALESRYYCAWEQEEIRDMSKIKEGLEIFEDICDSIIDNMPNDGTAYEKYYYLAEEVSKRLEYDYDFATPGLMTSYSIVTGYAVCTGYAEIYQYLCMKANLFCHLVYGYGKTSLGDSEYHVWNLIQVDGETYYVDVTWCDSLGNPGDSEWKRYFCLTQEELSEDHTITDGTVATGTISHYAEMR